MASTPAPAIWAVIRGWPNPAVLFLLLNLVIGVIAITSKGLRSRHRHGGGGVGDGRGGGGGGGERHVEGPPKLQRSGSSVVFERLRSMGLYPYRSGEFKAEDIQVAQDPEPQHGLYRTASSVVFEQLRSLGLYRNQSGESRPESSEHVHVAPDLEPQEHQFGRSHSESQATKEKEAVKVRKSASAKSAAKKQIRLKAEDIQAVQDPEPQHGLYRTASSVVFERLRSLGLSRNQSSESRPESSEHVRVAPDLEPQEHQFGRSHSESRATKGKEAVKVRKSASAKSAAEKQIRRRPAVAAAAEEEEEEGEEEVDARADDFINRFRQQLKLQRLDSIMRYKDMLTRGR